MLKAEAGKRRKEREGKKGVNGGYQMKSYYVSQNFV